MEYIKQRIASYWSQRSEDFEKQRQREFNSEKKDFYFEELQKYLPNGRPLRILDIGTGTGFFACLMAQKGHEAIGIDMSSDMIGHARHMADFLGINAEFAVMDAEKPEFEPESFDALISRNVTWTLPHLDLAYRKWYGLLKKGGVLINFDADYCATIDQTKEIELPKNHAHKMLPDSLAKENESITKELSAFQKPRPQWDFELLLQAGFERVFVDTGVHKRIYRDIDEFYNPVPIFAIAAYKSSASPT